MRRTKEKNKKQNQIKQTCHTNANATKSNNKRAGENKDEKPNEENQQLPKKRAISDEIKGAIKNRIEKKTAGLKEASTSNERPRERAKESQPRPVLIFLFITKGYEILVVFGERPRSHRGPTKSIDRCAPSNGKTRSANATPSSSFLERKRTRRATFADLDSSLGAGEERERNKKKPARSLT